MVEIFVADFIARDLDLARRRRGDDGLDSVVYQKAMKMVGII